MEIKKILFHKKTMLLTLLLLIATVGIYFKEQETLELSNEGGVGIYTIDQQEEYINSYESYISEIVSKSEEMEGISIFSDENSFSNQNMKKTKLDYEKMKEVKVKYGEYNGLSSVVTLKITDYIILIFSIVMVWNFFEDEKKGLKSIFFAAPQGRGALVRRRIKTIGAAVTFFVILLYSLLFSLAWCKYGSWESLFQPVQSSPLFIDCVFQINVLGYMLWYVAIRIIMAWAVCVFIWMMLSLFRSLILSIAVFIAVVGIEAFLTMALSEQSPVVCLKYINVFQVISPGELLYAYRNFNFGGNLCNCFKTLMCVTCAMGGIGSAVCLLIGSYRKPFHSVSRVESVLSGVFGYIRQGYHKVISKLGLMGMEFYKILILQKGLIFVLVWAYILIASTDTTPVQYMGNNMIMQEIYNEYSGPLDGRLEEFLENQNELLEQEQNAYEEAMQAYEKGGITLEELTGKSNYYASFEPLAKCVENASNQLLYLENLEKEKNIEGWFVDNRGYKFLLTDDGLYSDAGFAPQEKRSLLCIILMILLLSMSFSYDRSSGLENLIHSMPDGREYLFRKKIKMAVFFVGFICICAYGLELYEIHQVYSLSGLEAPVQSLLFMKDFPLRINILTFLILLEAIRVMILFSLSMIVLLISMKFNGVKGILISFMVLCLPELIKMLGVSWVDKISLVQPLVYVEALHLHGFGYSIIIVVFTVAVGIICCCLARKTWCRLFRK